MYSDEARHDLELLKTTWLIDEFNRTLKSVVNYREALADLLNEAPELEDYLKKFLVVLTGDFPRWKYNKKIIAEVCYALNHIHVQIPTAKTRQTCSAKKGTSFKYLSESDYYLVKGSGREESGIIFSLPLTISVVITLYYFIGQWDPLREPANSVPSFIPWQ